MPPNPGYIGAHGWYFRGLSENPQQQRPCNQPETSATNQTIELLSRVLMDETDPDIRCMAAEQLGRMGNERAINTIKTVQGDSDRWIQRIANEATCSNRRLLTADCFLCESVVLRLTMRQVL